MDNKKIIRIGVVGVGHLGNFHLKQLMTISDFFITGLYDKNINRADEIAKKYNINNYINLNQLLEDSDAISIVTPTSTHYSIANEALNLDCHVFIEKPIASNLNDAKKLLFKANQKNKIIQVGHIERFNPAFNVIKNMKLKPKFIESHRLSKFNYRGNDVPVILDLMIHDIDIILSLIKSEVKDIKANGVKVVSKTVDMANARIEFVNGCIANLTASRISQKNLRKMRIFQRKDYITIDFKESIINEYNVSNKKELSNGRKIIACIEEIEKKYIRYRKPKIEQYNALNKELVHFFDSIKNNVSPETDGKSATKALDIALKIHKLINE